MEQAAQQLTIHTISDITIMVVVIIFIESKWTKLFKGTVGPIHNDHNRLGTIVGIFLQEIQRQQARAHGAARQLLSQNYRRDGGTGLS